jgi:hypothetical protein
MGVEQDNISILTVRIGSRKKFESKPQEAEKVQSIALN